MTPPPDGASPQRRVIVIGAGAAGCMAAIFAATSGADVTLVERTRDGGRKILISGGGRCNVLPAHVDESRFVTDSSPNLLRKMVRAWPLAEQRAFFEHTLGIPLEEEVESAKLFPASHRARDVRDGLMDYAREVGVRLRMETRVTGFSPEGTGWAVSVVAGEDQRAVVMHADAVVVGTGGLSVPNTGSDGAGLQMLRALGHEFNPTYAALTPLTIEGSPYTELAGISLTVSLSAKSQQHRADARGGFLFTHRGYSGPAALNVSHVAVRARQDGGGKSGSERATVQVQWTEHDDNAWDNLLKPQGARTVTGALRNEMPDRLAAVLLAQAGVDPTRSLSELRRDERLRLIDTLVRGTLPWSGDEGYKKAEVMGGGVALSEVHARTMESRRHPGLYLCGEVLDAFGPIGGYNFLWAWATGRSAGMAAARSAPHV